MKLCKQVDEFSGSVNPITTNGVTAIDSTIHLTVVVVHRIKSFVDSDIHNEYKFPMRCRHCNYLLFNLTHNDCPECGQSFDIEEYRFDLGAVAFHCPQCDQEYYGNDDRGLPVPRRFDCVQCGRHISLNEMRVEPLQPDVEGYLGSPWDNRHKLGTISAWWATVKMTMSKPGTFYRIHAGKSIYEAWLYSTITQYVGLLPIMLFQAVMMWAMINWVATMPVMPAPPGTLPYVAPNMAPPATQSTDKETTQGDTEPKISEKVTPTGNNTDTQSISTKTQNSNTVKTSIQSTATPPGAVPMAPVMPPVSFWFLFAIYGLIGVVLPLFVQFITCGIWTVTIHMALFFLAPNRKSMDYTLRTGMYSLGPYSLYIIPICGAWIGGIWQLVTLIVGIKEVHSISGWRAAFAVLWPVVVFFFLYFAAVFLLIYNDVTTL